MTDEPNIVEGVGIAAASMDGERTDLSRAIEAAMSQAVTDCYAEGISDPDVMRERMRLAAAQVTGE